MSDVAWSRVRPVCPHCRSSFAADASGASCAACGARYPVENGILRLALGREGAPGYDPHFFNTLERIEGRHFWFVARREVILDALRRAVPDLERRGLFDIGCGSGWLSEAIATELDGSGTVYAVELQESHIENLRRRALPGIVPVLSEPGDVSLPENSLDVAMLHDVASHIDGSARKSFYESVRSALRPGGRLVVFGPHGEAETMLDVLQANGFVPVDRDLDDLTPDDLDLRLSEGIVFRPAPEAAPQEP